MGYPKKANRFAVQFSDLAEVFRDDSTKVVVVPCRNQRAADRMRLQFYAFRNAARSDGLMDPNDSYNLCALDTVEVLINKETHQVTFQCKDYSDIAEALNQGLRDAGYVPSTDPLPEAKKP